MVMVFKFQEPDKLTDPRIGTAEAIQRLEGAQRIDHEAVDVDASELDKDGLMPPGFRGDEPHVYSLDELVDVDGRASTIREEWGTSNAFLQRSLNQNEATGWQVVFRAAKDPLALNVSREVHGSVQSGLAWSNRARSRDRR